MNTKIKTSKSIESLIPYKPGKALSETLREYNLEKAYKLASNENALGVSEKVKQALVDAAGDIHRYPDPGAYDLRKALSNKLDIPGEYLSFGNGSNEIIDILIRVFCHENDRVLTSKAAFIAYKICAQAAGIACDEVAMSEGLKVDIKALMNSWRPQHKIVFVPNPNNPTGTYITKQETEELVSFFSNKECLLVFDEAYVEFVRAADYQEAINYWDSDNNIVVMRTLSKSYGLAGLRLGYILANARVTDYFNRVRNPFNVNHMAQVAGIAAINDEDYIKKSQNLVWQGLDFFAQRLKKMGLNFVPSQTNFILMECPEGQNGELLSQKLLQKGVITRPVDAYNLASYLRISVGLMEENEVAMQALSEVL